MAISVGCILVFVYFNFLYVDSNYQSDRVKMDLTWVNYIAFAPLLMLFLIKHIFHWKYESSIFSISLFVVTVLAHAGALLLLYPIYTYKTNPGGEDFGPIYAVIAFFLALFVGWLSAIWLQVRLIEGARISK